MSFARALAHVAAMGVGAGLFDTLLNAVTVERWGERSVRPMAWLHAMVPVGAIATPWLVSQDRGAAAWVDFFHGVAAAFLALSLWVALVPLPAPTASQLAGERVDPRAFRQPAFVAMCVVALAYIGVEAALTLFAVPYRHGRARPRRDERTTRHQAPCGSASGSAACCSCCPSEAPTRAPITVAGWSGAALIAAGTALGVTPRAADGRQRPRALGRLPADDRACRAARAGRPRPRRRSRRRARLAGRLRASALTGAIADASSIAIAMGSLAVVVRLIAAAGAYAHARRRAG